MGHFATGITVVTSGSSEGPAGLTVNSLTSVSLDPLIVLVCLEKKLPFVDVVRSSRAFAVNILGESQEDLSRLFATANSKRPATLFVEGTAGQPILRDATAVLECEVRDFVEGGDHWILTAEVRAMRLSGDAERLPLVFFRGQYRKLR